MACISAVGRKVQTCLYFHYSLCVLGIQLRKGSLIKIHSLKLYGLYETFLITALVKDTSQACIREAISLHFYCFAKIKILTLQFFPPFPRINNKLNSVLVKYLKTCFGFFQYFLKIVI